MTGIKLAVMPRGIKSGKDIRRERVKLPLSQERLAQILQVSVFTISRWERGVIEPSALVLRGIEGFMADYKKKGGKK